MKDPTKQANDLARRKALAKKVSRIGLGIALLSAGLIFIHPTGAEGKKRTAEGVQVPGAPAGVLSSAVVNFQELARQSASSPSGGEPAAKAMPEPQELDDSINDGIKGEPPPNVPVDIPSPSIPSPSPANNYAALDDIPFAPPGTPFFTIPPDTMGAVGTNAVNKVLVTLNNNFRILNKTTGAQIGTDVSMTNFWAPVGSISPFDPRVQYDPYNNRWLVAAVSDAGRSTAAILVGISLTDDPGGSYLIAKVGARVTGDAAAINFADFPMLGFNKNWMVVSINMFNGTTGAFNDGRSLVIDYPTLRTGSFAATYFVGVSAANAGFCMHPATTYSSTEGTEFLVAHLSSAGATYRMHTITGTPGAPVFTVGAVKVRPGGGWTQPGGNRLPQSKVGSTGTCATATAALSLIDVGDAFVRSNVVFRNSSIWYPQTVGLPAGGAFTHTAAQWTQLDTSGSVLQGGRVEDPTATATNGGKWYTYASIAVNATDDVLLGFTQGSSAQFASSGYTYRDHTDAAGTMRDPFIFKAGEDCYSKDFGAGRNRWGDYSHSMADPTGDCSFWTIQEYAKLSAPPTVGGSNSKWATWWAKVNSLTCGALTGLSPAKLWVGLKNSDDQGTQFDVKVEILKNGTPIASGLQRCMTGLTRNPSLAKETNVSFDPFGPVPFSSGDVVSLRVSTRIGTNPDGTKCAGPGGSHNSALGLRLYYDAASRASHFDATIPPSSSENLYLHSDGSPCPNGDGDSPGVINRTLDDVAPVAASAKCKNSGIVNFAGGNPFSVVGTWSLAPVP